MDQLSKKKVIKKPTVVEGQGTGTSDEIKASVPEGSFVMPADSTARLGVGKKFGDSPRQVDVNLSSGEAVIPPDEAAAIGHGTLEHLKNQTHTPVEQPHVQTGESGEPELFFANGGFVGSPYPNADDIRKARRGTNFPSTRHAQEFIGRQHQAGGPPQARMGQTYEGQARNVNPPPSTRHAQEFIGRQQQAGGTPQARTGQTYNGQARNVNPPPSTRHAQEFIGRQQQAGGTPQARTGQTYNGQARTVSPQAPTGGSGGAALGTSGSGGAGTPPVSGAGGAGLGARAWNTAKNFGKGMTQFATAGGLLANAYTPSEQYRERFGIGEQSAEDLGTAKGFAKDFGVRTLGYASDVGNILTGGMAGRFYQDNINREAQMAKQAAQPQAQPKVEPQAQPQPKARSLAETAGMSQQPQAQPQVQPQAQAQAQPQAQSNSPYAIVQNGTSFSYANPQAASQARAAGIPEGQAPNVIGGVRGAGDPQGVANFLNNTREFGPTEDQIQRALDERMQGFIGTQRQPQYEGLNEQQQYERANLISAANAPIKGARGMTANQLNTLAKIQQGDEDRIQGRYQIDANNFANMQQTMARETGATGRTAMQESGATGRTAMQEQGANYRNDGNLQHSYWRDGNNLALDNRRVSLDEMKEGPGIRTAQRIESLRDKYANATTDEEKQALLGLMNLYGGKDASQATNGKDRFINVSRPADPVNGFAGGQALYDTVTGEWLEAPGGASPEEGGAKQFVKGKTYTDPQSGKSAYLDDNGNWIEYRGN